MEFPVLDFSSAIPLPRGVAKSMDFCLLRDTELYPVRKCPRRREPIRLDLAVYCIFGDAVISHFLFAIYAALNGYRTEKPRFVQLGPPEGPNTLFHAFA